MIDDKTLAQIPGNVFDPDQIGWSNKEVCNETLFTRWQTN
jgi:hypothetical protein